ncbi:hypothetical protein F2Q68_00008636 [Brassica cretica]|uniref:Uncharacterized protein n=1 Tax=Brassica cretica TaxID=69181 RepID=A0A8S9KT37_BRACR|nr:hypothetical protein F2Q68_00008636 [Brassica cretica]
MGRGRPEECINAKSSPNIAFMSIAPSVTSVGTPFMNTMGMIRFMAIHCEEILHAIVTHTSTIRGRRRVTEKKGRYLR